MNRRRSPVWSNCIGEFLSGGGFSTLPPWFSAYNAAANARGITSAQNRTNVEVPGGSTGGADAPIEVSGVAVQTVRFATKRPTIVVAVHVVLSLLIKLTIGAEAASC